MYDKAYELDDKGQSFDRHGHARLACYHCAKRARDEYAATLTDPARRAAFQTESEKLFNEAEDYMRKMAKLSRENDEAYKKMFGHYPVI